MDLQFDEHELEFSLNLATIKNWLNDDLHKRLFHILTLESYSQDPDNDSKKLFVLVSKDINPTSFALTLQKLRQKQTAGSESFCTFLMNSLLFLCKMTESQSREETLKFVEGKEAQFKNIEDDLFIGIEAVKKFLKEEKNQKYVQKILKNNLEPEEGTYIYDVFKSACDNGTLESCLETGDKEEGGIWKAIIEMVKALIQMKGRDDSLDTFGDEDV